jgi:hypothetical protein
MTRPGLKKANSDRGYWFERLMATIALLNLILVAFDLSYIPWRDLYLRYLPTLTQKYGANFKGIEPHRDTAAYLKTVDQLESQVAETGLRSTEVSSLLTELRTQSNLIINENPFAIANKTGTLERIKNRMRDHMREKSSHVAFEKFWSQADLSQAGWSQEIAFFDREIRPMIATNYYRNVGINGEFIDRFWWIDIWFVALFSIEYLTRTFYLSRRYRGVNWFDAMLWQWHDLFLLLPFWRWLRVIPVTIRLNHSRLLNLEPIRTRLTHGFVTSFAVELTEIVVLRIMSQIQELVKQGNVTRWLLRPQTQAYVDLNNVNEVEVIFRRLLSILVDQVLPQVRPEIETLVNHSLNQVFQQNPVYANLQRLPGLGSLPTQLTEQLVSEIYKAVYDSLAASVNNSQAESLTRDLLQKFGDTFRTEVQREKTLEELEDLVTVLLEEIKINYVDRLSELDLEGLQQQNHQLYEIVRGNKQQLKSSK